MKEWMLDVYTWLFEQSGFSWREWRELSKSAREDDFVFPSDWHGDW